MSEINIDDLYEIKNKAFASSHVLNRNFKEITKAHNDLEGRVKGIESSPLSDAEVQTARGGYETLKERLDIVGETKRNNTVIKGMGVGDITYNESEDKVSFTIKKGDVFLQGKSIKVATDTTFTDIPVDQNYRVVVCDTLGVISILTQDLPEHQFPTVGQDKRPLYLFKKESYLGFESSGQEDSDLISYPSGVFNLFLDCRHWGVVSLMGWHFNVQEAVDDFFDHYFEELHALGHRYLTLEYTGRINGIQKILGSHDDEVLRSKLNQWTFKVKGVGGAEFFFEGVREFESYTNTDYHMVGIYHLKNFIFENIFFQYAPWFSSGESLYLFTMHQCVFKDCEIDLTTSPLAYYYTKFFSAPRGFGVTYINTNIKTAPGTFSFSHFEYDLHINRLNGLSINDVPIYEEAVIDAKVGLSGGTHLSDQGPVERKSYVLYQINVSNIDLNTTSPVTLVSNINNRSIYNFRLISAFVTQRNDDLTRAGFFYTEDGDFKFDSTTDLIRNSDYSDVSVALVFKVYNWEYLIGEFTKRELRK